MQEFFCGGEENRDVSKLILAISLLLCGCIGKPANPGMEKHEGKEQTMGQWIDKMNARKEKCEGDGWRASGGNGYDYWSAQCSNGVVVYKDTTKEFQEWEAKEQLHKKVLIAAARTRILTAKETGELLAYGSSIFISPMQPYYQNDVDKQFDELMLQQARLRACCSAEASQ